jgi:protein-L-isoaspartate(D-aspartate) O-methyltransferase
VVGLGIVIPVASGAEADGRAAERRAMSDVIQAHARSAPGALDRDHVDATVIAAMALIPRHEFVPEDLRPFAYLDRPLPIGYGQTISQPFIVALMTDLLRVRQHHTVLEVGTGSGYQAAVLAPLAGRVHSIEIIPALARRAAATLKRLGLANVTTRAGDGYYGWPEAGPFDGIIVTAASSQIPPPLVRQLKPGGRMVIPVGGPFTVQHLMLVEKRADGRVRTRQLLPVRFVPLTGKH